MKNQNRETFRESVFDRDNKCVVLSCDKEATDAHHLIERRLWIKSKEKGGYLVDNGVSLCNFHHQLAERNILSPQVLRMWAGLPTVLPSQFNVNKDYNKWGEEMNMPARMFVKYPSTSYLSFSENIIAKRVTSNPIADNNNFVGFPIVITMKMDGSNVVMTDHHVAARNGYDARHKSFDYIKAIHASIKHLIPENIQVFGEWLYAKHSIHYSEDVPLKSYLQIFGVYDNQKRLFLGWGSVESYAKLLGYPTTPYIDIMTFSDKYVFAATVTQIAKENISQGNEGVVVRSVYPFHYSQFETYLAKYVRPNHVQTNKHWQNQRITRNVLER